VDLWDFLRILARRWFILIPGLIVVFEGAFLVTSRAGTQYQATGSVLLVAPSPTAANSKTPSAPVPTNPYFPGSLDLSASLMVRVMTTDDATVSRLHKAGATANYTIITGTGPGTENHSPVISISASGASSPEVLATIHVVSKGVQQVLTERQQASGAPSQNWIRAEILTVPEQATRVIGSAVRTFVAVAGLGTAGVILLVFLIEGLLERRQARRTSPLIAARGSNGGEPLMGEVARDIRTVERQP
jgi:hypothetical protein